MNSLLSIWIFMSSKIQKCLFFDKIGALEQKHIGKWTWSIWNLILCFTNNVNILCLKIDMACKIENGFYWLVCFHCEYFRTQKLKNVFFEIKLLVSADTVLKSWCSHTETLLSEIGNGFYWLICFIGPKIQISCFRSKIILLRRHSFKNWAPSVLKFAYFNIYAWCGR